MACAALKYRCTVWGRTDTESEEHLGLLQSKKRRRVIHVCKSRLCCRRHVCAPLNSSSTWAQTVTDPVALLTTFSCCRYIHSAVKLNKETRTVRPFCSEYIYIEETLLKLNEYASNLQQQVCLWEKPNTWLDYVQVSVFDWMKHYVYGWTGLARRWFVVVVSLFKAMGKIRFFTSL